MSALRAIAPSANQDESSSSSPAKFTPPESNSGLISGATGLPSGSGEAAGGRDPGSGGDGGQRKRRATGSVSQMACTPCRTARQRVRNLFFPSSIRDRLVFPPRMSL